MLSIIIPTLNADTTLQATLDSCMAGAASPRVVVSDGGSNDDTLSIAKQNKCTVVSAECGRGTQLAAGAAMAQDDWLLFLHADSRLPDNWSTVVSEFVDEPLNMFRAAVFQLALDDTLAQARHIEWFVKWRTRLLALPYGDQGLLISRAYHDCIGGYRPIPIMEDVDLVRRIRRPNLQVLDAAITTSAHKYQRDGYWKRPLKNLGLMCLYGLGVPESKLSEFYQ